MRITLIAFLVFFLQGCSPKVRVTIDSVSSTQAREKNKYFIIPDPDKNDGDLCVQEYVALTEKALESEGFEKSATLDDADVGIFLSYGISGPEVYFYTYPTSTYLPCCRTTIYHTGIGKIIEYTGHLDLYGVDFKEWLNAKEYLPLWETHAVSTGPISDLRKVFPIMLGVSRKYIAKSSKKKITFEVSEKDKRVQELLELE